MLSARSSCRSRVRPRPRQFCGVYLYLPSYRGEGPISIQYTLVGRGPLLESRSLRLWRSGSRQTSCPPRSIRQPTLGRAGLRDYYSGDSLGSFQRGFL